MKPVLLAALGVLMLSACGDGANQSVADRDKEGQYGASSADNPNLADIQNENQQLDPTATTPSAPSAGQTDQQGNTVATPGADGGRGSAQTGATNNP